MINLFRWFDRDMMELSSDIRSAFLGYPDGNCRVPIGFQFIPWFRIGMAASRKSNSQEQQGRGCF